MITAISVPSLLSVICVLFVCVPVCVPVCVLHNNMYRCAQCAVEEAALGAAACVSLCQEFPPLLHTDVLQADETSCCRLSRLTAPHAPDAT